jgi:hypothetical protein
MNEKSLESRRVRTQPCTSIESIGAVLCKASLIGVGEGCVILDPEIDSFLSGLSRR